jgi:hypothetical protein
LKNHIKWYSYVSKFLGGWPWLLEKGKSIGDSEVDGLIMVAIRSGEGLADGEGGVEQDCISISGLGW